MQVRKRKTESERMEAELQNKLNIIEQTIKYVLHSLLLLFLHLLDSSESSKQDLRSWSQLGSFHDILQNVIDLIAFSGEVPNDVCCQKALLCT